MDTNEPTESNGRTEGTADAVPTTRLTPGMRRVLGISGAVLAVAIAGAIWLMTTSGGQTPIGTDAAATPGATPGAMPEPSVTHGPVPGATPTTGTEVPDPDTSAPPTSGLPPLPAPTPLIDGPLPDSGSESGALVDGFPDSVMGPVPGSDVLESSIATEGSTMQVTLVARTDASADEVRSHFRELWSQLGLTESAGGIEGAVTFSNDHSSLSLAFAPASGTGTVYMIYSVLRTS
ncbi:hypothetical protein J2X03_000710 [Microbacterium trichothecenolyticum]|uniref:hypothetical protein n=1 Tax=Microbacterium trichothecenolyticum TaxID=69370 RepID=UPI00285A5786|nr:hypothetical protein [Microbacterium trichothecenolyticum]MDR7110854.1 hypothetical protein [Microbacterium trichothecenolyticum]